MRNMLVFAMLVLVAAGLAPRYFAHVDSSTVAVAKVTTPEPSTSAANASSMTIARGDNGHFSVEGTVDGRHMEFLVDTGASVIALREGDAALLGIHPAEREYTARVSTANGVVRAAPIELNRVEIGPLTVRNVAALVLPDEALSQNLLGMSFLSRVRWEHRNGRLVLEQ